MQKLGSARVDGRKPFPLLSSLTAYDTIPSATEDEPEGTIAGAARQRFPSICSSFTWSSPPSVGRAARSDVIKI